MAMPPNFKVTELTASVRWIKGYRYLDKCGEALVLLDDRLDPGWISGEITPTGGNLRNFRLGMSAVFQASFLTIRQAEFISHEHFAEEACKLYDTLRDVFEIDRLNAPSFLAVLQHGCNGTEEAEELLKGLSFCSPSKQVVKWLGGEHEGVSMAFSTKASVEWEGTHATQRRRFEYGAVKQARQPDFDNRLLLRLPLLSIKDQQVMSTLQQLRRTHPEPKEFAAQVSLENAFESEFSTRQFNLTDFLAHSWDWVSTTINASARATLIAQLQTGPKRNRRHLALQRRSQLLMS
jgi:hypothetical protein